MFLDESDAKPPCWQQTDLFFGTEDDARSEAERDIRESEARSLCHGCQYRWRCLERAVVHKERYGVWGGLGEAERKRFQEHLAAEGYSNRDMPHGAELVAALQEFYRAEYRERALARVVELRRIPA
jgi:WhiB family redox-sensing transcriptional regulator